MQHAHIPFPCVAVQSVNKMLVNEWGKWDEFYVCKFIRNRLYMVVFQTCTELSSSNSLDNLVESTQSFSKPNLPVELFWGTNSVENLFAKVTFE